jgi:hypothetical protein
VLSKENAMQLLRSALVVACVVVLLGTAPAALAIPADQRRIPPRATPAPVVHLTPSQLRAVDGHQPVDPPVVSAPPPAATPLKAAGSRVAVPEAWVPMLAGAAVAVFGAVAFRFAAHRPLVPRRRRRASV